LTSTRSQEFPFWIADGTGNAFREVGDIARFDLYPFASDVHLALAFETHNGFVSHVVIVERTFSPGASVIT
jgi:hypothetical protein